MQQYFYDGPGGVDKLGEIADVNKISRILLVCGHSAEATDMFRLILRRMEQQGVQVCLFQEFHPNPDYQSVRSGIAVRKDKQCGMLVALGGGSAIDVAKSIKSGVRIDERDGKLYRSVEVCDIPFMAIPTTAGSGSEATHFSVIYYKSRKISVADPAMLPDYVVLDESCLKTLPVRQRKATALDALCHGIESMWSVNSTDISCGHASRAIKGIIGNMDKYIFADGAEKEMLIAANEAGRAINLTETTAAHAMSYKLTTEFHLPHGQAVMLCLPELWEYMLQHMGQCIDPRGSAFLRNRFGAVSEAMGCATGEEAVEFLKRLRRRLGMEFDRDVSLHRTEFFAGEVNAERLKNNPILLNHQDLVEIYQNILKAG